MGTHYGYLLRTTHPWVSGGYPLPAHGWVWAYPLWVAHGPAEVYAHFVFIGAMAKTLAVSLDAAKTAIGDTGN